MIRTPTLLAVVIALASVSCTSGDDTTGDTIDDASTSSSVTTASTTTTTEPPIVRGLGESLGLAAGQCYDDVPETTTTTSTTTTTTPPTSESDETTTTPPTTAAPTTEPPPITTTIPRPPLVAIVECEGTNRGVVFASFCIGSLVEAPELVDIPSELGETPCPGDPSLEWPGDRLLRRAAARVCVDRFDAAFGEPYALSEIGTTEFVPSRGVWERGDRRIVCTADQN